MDIIQKITDLIKAGFGGYAGWPEVEALADFRATGGAGKYTGSPIDAFFAKWNRKFIDYDRTYGYQCVDLMRQFVKEVYNLDPYKAIPTTGYAKNIFNNFKENQYFGKIPNIPYGIPKKGDIVFWGYYPFLYGWEGHVGIYDSGDLYTIVSFDQNYPTGQPCRFVRHGTNRWLHGYRGCLGWLSRK